MNACTAVPDGVLPEVPPVMRYASSTLLRLDIAEHVHNFQSAV